MAQEEFSTAEIARQTGFTERQLGYWDQRGIVRPSGQQSSGPGSRRVYTTDDLVQLNLIRQLKNHSWSTQKIREAVARLRDVMNDPNPLKSAIVVDGKGTMLALYKTKEGERVLFDVLNGGGQLVMGVALEMLLEEAHRVVTYSTEKVSSR
jgi:DNA-binding transcriptional MerR regulator